MRTITRPLGYVLKLDSDWAWQSRRYTVRAVDVSVVCTHRVDDLNVEPDLLACLAKRRVVRQFVDFYMPSWR